MYLRFHFIQMHYLQASPREASWWDIVVNIKMRLPVGGAVVGVGTKMDTPTE